MHRFFFASILLATGSLAGCSQNTDDLFQSGSQGGAAGSSQTTGSPSTNAATNATTSAKTTSVGPTTKATTSGITTDATSVTVGPTVTTDATTTVNVVSASSGSGPTVDCGGAGSCDAQTSVCCYDHSTHGAMCTAQQACQPSGGNQPTAITCQTPQDCPSQQLCCAVRYFGQDNQPYQYTQCQNQCDLPDRIVCDPTNPACPIYTNNTGMQVQSTCKASVLLPQGYSVCSF